MEFSTKVSAPDTEQSACVAVAVFEGHRLSPSAETLDRASGGQLRALLRGGDMEAKSATTRVLYRIPGISAQRVVLVGMGKEKSVGAREYRDGVSAAIGAIRETGAASACMYLAEIAVKGRDAAWKARHAVTVASDSLYRFEQMKSKKGEARPLAHVALGLGARRDLAPVERGIAEGLAIAAGVGMARDLGNLPGNVCTPTYLAEYAARLAKENRLAVEVLDRNAMARLGMGSMLSVARGSKQAPKFIVLRHAGASKKDRPVVLIGKGITFDSGGISLKPGAEMDEMKFDMCGAASVLGTLRAAAQMKIRLNVVGLIPATENMPGGAASKPGDIVTSMSGQTIEVLNTDAEGRLILCDALTYAARLDPLLVIDIATLTGACVIALGHVCSGLFANRDALAREIIGAGEDSSDRVWQLPLWEDYQEQLKSNFADVANIGGRAAGSITAACFLSRFAGDFPWAHLDIAGTAWKSGKEKGATGRPVPLLTSFLMRKAGKK